MTAVGDVRGDEPARRRAPWCRSRCAASTRTRSIDAVRLAGGGGATVPGVVWLEEKWGLENDDDVAELATIVGTQRRRSASVRDAAAEGACHPPVDGSDARARGPTCSPSSPTRSFVVVRESVDDEPFDATTLDGPGCAPAPRRRHRRASSRPARSTVPLARGAGRARAAGRRRRRLAPGRGRPGAGRRTRRRSSTTSSSWRAVATVDNFDQLDGPLTAVLVLGDRGQGVVGHYGSGVGAERPMPEWWIV